MQKLLTFDARIMSIALYRWKLLASRTYHTGTVSIRGTNYATSPNWTNVTDNVLRQVGKSLHLQKLHPIGILRELMESKLLSVEPDFKLFNNFTPVVNKYQNFDSLGFPLNHPGRSKSDTYYINENCLLRTHTSAHELECFQWLKNHSNYSGFLISADVYRRDEIDRTHYPIFHQMEGCKVWDHKDMKVLNRDLTKLKDNLNNHEVEFICIQDDPAIDPLTNPKQSYMSDEEVELCSANLKRSMELVIFEVFNKKLQSMRRDNIELPPNIKYRWVRSYFPWTAPSWEIEIWWQDNWLEVSGCGLIKQDVLLKAGYQLNEKIGWAFGMGLDRLAMLLFEIPDIRLLWTQDERFHNQFTSNQITTFKPYSKLPGSKRDIAFWLPQENKTAEFVDDCKDNEGTIHTNDVMEIVREVAGDLVENVKLVDSFVNPKTDRKSLCFRINYQSMDRNLTNAEVNDLQHKVERLLTERYHVTIR